MIKLKDLITESIEDVERWMNTKSKARETGDREYVKQYLAWKADGKRGEGPVPSLSRSSTYLRWNVDKLLNELSYSGNLGVMELVNFYDSASKSQIAMLQNFIDAKKWDKAHALIQKVTKVKLVGFGEDQEIDPRHADPEAIFNPDTSKSFERSKKWGGNVGHPWQGA